MGFRTSAAILICLVLSTIPFSQAQASTLVHNGTSSYEIVLSDSASPSEKHAADELQSFLYQISGAKLPIVGETGKHGKMIVLGSCDTQRKLSPELDIKAMGDEGFAIKTVGSNLVIAGGRLRGTMYGVYTFLEDVLGCRWYTSTVSRIPKKRDIQIKSLNIAQKPDFEYREPFYTDAWDADWAARNKTNGNSTRLDETRGGKVRYGHAFCHTYASLVPPDKYFDTHPEYYSLVGNERKGKQYDGQLCLTNPDVLKIATETVMQWIEEDRSAKIISVTQNDNPSYCQCDKCKAIDAEEGSPSGAVLRFANAVADEVAKKYPDVLIDTFAYWYTENPPKITKPRPNVRIRLCPISNCQHHPYEQCPNDAHFMDNLRAWNAITNNTLYIWHYNTNFANYLLPLPDLDELPADVRLYKRSGVVGVFWEGTYNAGNGPYGGAGWMDDLKAYMLAKLSWNVDADPRAIRDDFLQGYFGKAGKPIGEYLDLLQDKVRKDNIHGGIYNSVDSASTSFLTDDIMAKSNALFDRAERLAADNDQLRRVKHARLSLRYVEVCKECKKAQSGRPEVKKMALYRLDEFRSDCESDGITSISEGGTLKDWYQNLAQSLK